MTNQHPDPWGQQSPQPQQPPYPQAQQHWQQPPPQPWQAQPPPPPQQPRRVVTRTRLSSGAHTFHLIATIFTLGAWSPIWFAHWLLARRKQVSYYR